jgi:hypothetical protein
MFHFHSVQTLTCQKLLATVVWRKHTCACLVQLVSQFICHNLLSLSTKDLVAIYYLMYCSCFSKLTGLYYIFLSYVRS